MLLFTFTKLHSYFVHWIDIWGLLHIEFLIHTELLCKRFPRCVKSQTTTAVCRCCTLLFDFMFDKICLLCWPDNMTFPQNYWGSGMYVPFAV